MRRDRNSEDTTHVQFWAPRELTEGVEARATLEERDKRTVWIRAMRQYLANPYQSDTVGDTGNQ